jgi:hypothetical protein
MRAVDPWADDRCEEGREERGRRRAEERRSARSVSPRGRTGSGADPAGVHPDRGSSTSWRSSHEVLHDVKARLRELKHGLSELQISQLVVEHPHEHARRPTRGHEPSSPGVGTTVLKHGRHHRHG